MHVVHGGYDFQVRIVVHDVELILGSWALNNIEAIMTIVYLKRLGLPSNDSVGRTLEPRLPL